jgi:hypothetical protein
MKAQITESVRRWYREIGAKGGHSGKGTELRKAISRQNALKRWKLAKAAGKTTWEKTKKRSKNTRFRITPPPPKKQPRKVVIEIPSINQEPVVGFK